MNKTALFIRHKAKPGRRNDVQRIWEKHVKPRVQANPAHEAYYFCHDDNDPDVVCVFQLYRDNDALKAFMKAIGTPTISMKFPKWLWPNPRSCPPRPYGQKKVNKQRRR